MSGSRRGRRHGWEREGWKERQKLEKKERKRDRDGRDGRETGMREKDRERSGRERERERERDRGVKEGVTGEKEKKITNTKKNRAILSCRTLLSRRE